MNTTIAKIISYTLQPLAMSLITVFIALNIDPYLATKFTASGKLALYSVIGLNTFIVPTLLVIYLKHLKIISSLDVEKRRERFIPFAITLILYGTTYYLLRRTPLPEPIYCIIGASILAMIIAFLITLFWKISIHMTGIGGVIGALLGLFSNHDYFNLIVFSTLLISAGLIGSARLKLQVHTIAQVIAGTILGIGTQYICLTEMLYL